MKEDQHPQFKGDLVHSPDLLTQVLEQIYKDTGLSPEELPWEMEDSEAYQKFIKIFRAFVARQYQSNRSRFMQLLYRIDIPESKYRKVMEQNQEEGALIDALTQTMLNRVLQKVVMRRHYDPRK